jgi:hypothetical protein
MKRSLFIGTVAALAVFAVLTAGRVLYRAYPVQVSLFVALTRAITSALGERLQARRGRN